jgi:O-antigen/teichoic acid export membrane protein
LYALGALAFWGLLMVLGDPLFTVLYGGNYDADIRLLAALGLLPLCSGITGVLESALFAAGRPKIAALNYAVSAGVTLVLGWPLHHKPTAIAPSARLMTATSPTCIGSKHPK